MFFLGVWRRRRTWRVSSFELRPNGPWSRFSNGRVRRSQKIWRNDTSQQPATSMFLQ